MDEGETDVRQWTMYVSVSVSGPLCIMSVHHCLSLSVCDCFLCVWSCVVHVHICVCVVHVCVLTMCVY